MKWTYPNSVAWYFLAWGAALAVFVAFLIAAAEWRHTRQLRRDDKAMSRSVGRILRAAARGEDYRSWR